MMKLITLSEQPETPGEFNESSLKTYIELIEKVLGGGTEVTVKALFEETWV